MKVTVLYVFLFLFVLNTVAQNQPTNMRFSLITSESVSVIFTPPSTGIAPDGYLALMSANEAPNVDPMDTETYLVNEQIGNVNGNTIYVVWSDSYPAFTTYSHEPGTLLYFKVYSYSGSGISIDYNTVSPLEGSITTPQQTLDELITYANPGPPELVGEGTDLILSFNFVDPGFGITELEISLGATEKVDYILDYYEDFFYNQVGTIVTRQIDNVTGSTYQVTISGEATTPVEIGKLGVIYLIVGKTASGNIYQLDYPRNVSVTKSAATVPIYSNFGSAVSNYQLISVPLELTQKSVDDVFGDDLGPYGNKKEWRMFRYDGGNEEVNGSTQIQAGEGYWLIAKNTTTFDIGPGNTVPPGLSGDIDEGWNLVGNPYPFDLLWSYVQDWSEPGLGALRVFEDGSFEAGTVLPAYGAGFVMADNNIVISFPAVDLSGGRIGREVEKFLNPLNSENWEVFFKIKNGDIKNNLGGIGMNTEASIEKDRFDDFTLPRFIEYIEVNHNKKFHEINYSKDVVPFEENHEWDFEIVSNTQSDVVELRWDNSYFGSNTKQLVLWDVNAQRAIDMRQQNQYVFNKVRSGNFKVFFGNPEFVREKTSVENLVFHPLYPNPATDNFVVSFTLPQQEIVTVELFDVLGRKSSILASASFEAGYHEVPVQYQGMSGVYFVQLSTGHTKGIKRLILGN